MQTVKALLHEAGELMLADLTDPQPSVDEVSIRVACVGLCRTDLAVVSGEVPLDGPIIPGHELCGSISALGSQIRDLEEGDWVTVQPRIGCNACSTCRSGWEALCPGAKQLGLDLHGALAEHIVVPARAVFKLPPIPPQRGAYSEPLAAALAVLDVGLDPHSPGVVVGDNRIAILIQRLLEHRGFSELSTVGSEHLAQLASDHFSFAIESENREGLLQHLVRIVAPRGNILLKSRSPFALHFDPTEAVLKNLSLHALAYGSFEDAVELLGDASFSLDGLLGPTYALSEYREAFAHARVDQQSKTFVALHA